MRYRKQMIGEAVEQIKTVNPKEIEAMISNNLQVLVTKQVIPKITQFVNEMKIKMNSFVQDLGKKNNLDGVVSELDEIKREIEEMKGMLTTLSYAPCEPELTERDVVNYIQEMKVNELAMELCKKQNQSLLIFALDQLEEHVDLLYEIQPGLLVNLAYFV